MISKDGFLSYRVLFSTAGDAEHPKVDFPRGNWEPVRMCRQKLRQVLSSSRVVSIGNERTISDGKNLTVLNIAPQNNSAVGSKRCATVDMRVVVRETRHA